MNIFSLILQIDKFITSLIFDLPSNVMTITFMRLLSFEGIFIFVWLLIFAYIYKSHFANHHKPHMLVEVLILLIVANTLLNAIIKPLFARVRPQQKAVALNPMSPNVLERITAIPQPDNHKPPITTAYPTDFSFPSGHATLAFAVATLFCIKNNKYSAYYLIIAGFVAFSRVYLGYHYFLDVVFGGLIGWATTRLLIRTKN